MKKIVLIIVISQIAFSLSIKEIEKDPSLYDRKGVTITGRVKEIRLSVSKKGSKYTTFSLDDGIINIFSYTHLSFKKGDRVRVKGIFYKKRYRFDMEIKAKPEDIYRVSGLNRLMIIGIILVAYIAWLLYRRYKAERDMLATRRQDTLFPKWEWYVTNNWKTRSCTQ